MSGAVISGIAAGVPIWVWMILTAIVGLGLMSMRTRQSHAALFLALPLLGLLGLKAMLSLDPAPVVWLVFALAYGGGVGLGLWAQRRWILSVESARVRLAGEPVTLILMLTLFMMNFAMGVATAIAPDIVAGPSIQIGFAAIQGAISGMFLGRSMAVFRAVMGAGRAIKGTAQSCKT